MKGELANPGSPGRMAVRPGVLLLLLLLLLLKMKRLE